MERSIDRYQQETQTETLRAAYQGLECHPDKHYVLDPWRPLPEMFRSYPSRFYKEYMDP